VEAEPAGDENRDGGKRGEHVVLLTRGEGEEEQNERRPKSQQQYSAAL